MGKKCRMMVLVLALIMASAFVNIAPVAALEVSAMEIAAPKDLATWRALSDEDIENLAENLSSFDARQYGVVPPVTNQGNYSLCWVYGSISAAEISILKEGFDEQYTRDNLRFSEENIAYRVVNKTTNRLPGLNPETFKNDAEAKWNTGRAEANVENVMSQWNGPFQMRDFNSKGITTFRYTGDDFIPPLLEEAGHMPILYKDNKVLMRKYKEIVLKYGAMSIGHNYSSRTSTEYWNSDGSNTLEHGVAIIGWDDSISRDLFEGKKPGQDGAWLIRDSWGSSAHGDGYFWLSYDSPINGGDYFDFGKMEYDYNYYYDSDAASIASFSAKPGQNYFKAANIYKASMGTAKKQEILSAVNISLGDAKGRPSTTDFTVQIDIYNNLENINPGNIEDPNNIPEQGTPVCSVQKEIPYAGCYTIKLDNPVKLDKGKYFSIVVKVSNPDNTASIRYSKEVASSTNDLSYVYDEATRKWTSSKIGDGVGAVARIKGYTKMEDREEALTEHLKNANIIIEGDSLEYNGNPWRPAVTVRYESDILKEGEDYYLIYSNNIKAGKATVSIIGRGRFEGQIVEENFTIAKASYPLGLDLWESYLQLNYVYENDAEKLSDLPLWDGWEFVEPNKLLSSYTIGKDYYADIKYTAEDADCYENTYSRYWLNVRDDSEQDSNKRIYSAEWSDSAITEYEYTGLPIRPKVDTMVLNESSYYGGTEGIEYAVSYSDNINPGEVIATVRGKRGFIGGIQLKFRIREPKTDISDASLEYKREGYEYDGVPVVPDVTVNFNGKILEKDVDYAIGFSDNEDAGNGKIKVFGIGEYGGTVSGTFVITQSDLPSTEVKDFDEIIDDDTVDAPVKPEDTEQDHQHTNPDEECEVNDETIQSQGGAIAINPGKPFNKNGLINEGDYNTCMDVQTNQVVDLPALIAARNKTDQYTMVLAFRSGCTICSSFMGQIANAGANSPLKSSNLRIYAVESSTIAMGSGSQTNSYNKLLNTGMLNLNNLRGLYNLDTFCWFPNQLDHLNIGYGDVHIPAVVLFKGNGKIPVARFYSFRGATADDYANALIALNGDKDFDFDNYNYNEQSITGDVNIDVNDCDDCNKPSEGSDTDVEKEEPPYVTPNQDHQHTLVTVPGKDATCTETGLSDKVHCSSCDYVQTESTVIDMIPHVTATRIKEAATCTEDGYKEEYCTVCNSITTENIEIIPATGHQNTAIENKSDVYSGDIICQDCRKTIETGEWLWENISAEYKITFKPNGGSGKMSAQKGVYKGSGNIKTNAYKKKGYSFKEWNTKADGTGNSYNDGVSIAPFANNKPVVLYAQWEKTEYTIEYVLNEGQIEAENPESYYIDTATITLNKPTREGYTFGGWYRNPKLSGSKVAKIKKGSTGNKTYYAKWIINKYSIVFKGNKSTSGSMRKMSSREYGKEYILKNNTFKKKGYTFVGWNTQADGTGETFDNMETVSFKVENKAVITLYAQWQLDEYTITYNNITDSDINNNPTMYNVTNATFKLTNPEREGNVFQGWYTNPKFTGSKVTAIKKGSTGDRILYAKWKYVENQGDDINGSVKGEKTDKDTDSDFIEETENSQNNDSEKNVDESGENEDNQGDDINGSVNDEKSDEKTDVESADKNETIPKEETEFPNKPENCYTHNWIAVYKYIDEKYHISHECSLCGFTVREAHTFYSSSCKYCSTEDSDVGNTETNGISSDSSWPPAWNTLPKNEIPTIVILSKPSFEQTLKTYIAHKTTQGFPVHEIYTSTSSAAEAKQEVMRFYESNGKNPIIVLIIGDGDSEWNKNYYFPSFEGSVSVFGKYRHKTDYHYGDFDGDWVQDVAVGRLPAREPKDLDALVEKIIFMENNVAINNSAAKNFIAINQSGTAGTEFSRVKEYVSGYGLNLSSFDVTSTQAISSSINDGAGFVFYAGHGFVNSFANAYTHVDVQNLTNNQIYPVVVASSCLTGDFESISCLGKVFVNSKQKGAIAYIGASNESDFRPNVFLSTGNSSKSLPGIIQSLYYTDATEEKYHAKNLGDVMHIAQNATRNYNTYNSSMVKQQLEIYNLMGDPTYMPYTDVSRQMVINCNDSVTTGDSFIVNTGVAYAQVALTQTDNSASAGVKIIDAVIADENGIAVLNVDSEKTVMGDAMLYAIGKNYRGEAIKIKIE